MRDKVIVITGASSGIGAAVAKRVAALQGRPVLAARRKAELERVAADCGANAVAVVADVTSRADVQRISQTTLERHGNIELWINNAGRGITRRVSELSDADFDEMMLVNTKAALYGMQAVLPHFRERGRGHIINISLMLGRVPFAPMRSAYNAAKHALNALTASLRMELMSTHPGIHVSLVSPGVVATDFGLNALGGRAGS